jgi:hypothetical protein
VHLALRSRKINADQGLASLARTLKSGQSRCYASLGAVHNTLGFWVP